MNTIEQLKSEYYEGIAGSLKRFQDSEKKRLETEEAELTATATKILQTSLRGIKETIEMGENRFEIISVTYDKYKLVEKVAYLGNKMKLPNVTFECNELEGAYGCATQYYAWVNLKKLYGK